MLGVVLSAVLLTGGCEQQPPHQVDIAPPDQPEALPTTQPANVKRDVPKLKEVRPLDTDPQDTPAAKPREKTPTLSEAAEAKKATPKNAVSYTVALKDTYWRIAVKKLGSGKRWREIEKLNPGVDRNKLKIGQVIYIPAK